VPRVARALYSSVAVAAAAARYNVVECLKLAGGGAGEADLRRNSEVGWGRRRNRSASAKLRGGGTAGGERGRG
jgi:hypothetical protein